jgi:hypothetical protein
MGYLRCEHVRPRRLLHVGNSPVAGYPAPATAAREDFSKTLLHGSFPARPVWENCGESCDRIAVVLDCTDAARTFIPAANVPPKNHPLPLSRSLEDFSQAAVGLAFLMEASGKMPSASTIETVLSLKMREKKKIFSS